MKKIITFIFAFAIFFTLTACSGNDTPSETRRRTPTNQSDTQSANNSALNDNSDNSDNSDNENTPSENLQSNIIISGDFGEIIEFGGMNWLVLDKRDGEVLLLSEEILKYDKRYSKETPETTWETSYMREYLNSEFFDETFTDEEKARIKQVTLTNEDNQWFGASGGNDTTDNVFLLSLAEVVRYFGDSGQLDEPPGTPEELTYEYLEDEFDSARIASRPDGLGGSLWLLRSPGISNARVAYVGTYGGIYPRGEGINMFGGVRPALWLSL